ncbi:M15 family metallopeptidase [Chitinibacter sp. S2-10]|uniref:M15 family metallopeptidase n=1 Tax=Chitinibacter sp. S2-10 TaxID=3373597 RepID=UPI003977D79A
MINSRNLGELLPAVKARAEAFIAECKRQGIEVLITSTYRDHESQAALYAQGRTEPGSKVTNAKPGQSWHNWRVAFDFVPIVNGKAQWGDAALFKRCGAIAESVGLEWAGRWKSFPEMAHCQFTGGLMLADFQAGKTLEAIA